MVSGTEKRRARGQYGTLRNERRELNEARRGRGSCKVWEKKKNEGFIMGFDSHDTRWI